MRIVTIMTTRKAYATRKFESVVVTRHELGLASTGVVWKMLEQLSKDSQVRPVERTTLETLLRALRLLTISQDWNVFANLRAEKISVEEVAEGFRAVEATLIQEVESKNNQRVSSRVLRGAIVKFLKIIGTPRIERLYRHFTTAIPRTVVAPRQLISDIPTSEEAPVAAIRHSTIADLRAKFKDRLEVDLKRIEDACEGEFNYLKKFQDYFRIVRERPRSLDMEEALFRGLGRSVTGYPYCRDRAKMVKEATVDQLESAYYWIVSEWLDSSQTMAPPSTRTVWKRLLIERVQNACGDSVRGDALNQTIIACSVGFSTTLVACWLVIQIRSGWNISSILEVSYDDITIESEKITVVGFKSKVDEETPELVINKSDSIGWKVMSFLIERLMWMRNNRWVDSGEQRMWLKSGRGGNPPELYQSWPKILRYFLKRHALPIFSPEQVRTQVIAAESLQVGGLEASRRLASHTKISTTGRYIDQLLLTRLNAASNLEFQRRFEKSVEYRMNYGVSVAEQQDDYMLYTVGDGSSCLNPLHPPAGFSVFDGVCEGRQCHIGGGCSYRRILITEERMEEVARTAAYYESNWRRLLDENFDLFESHHIHVFMFSLAFSGVLSRGPHRAFFSSIVSAIGRDCD